MSKRKLLLADDSITIQKVVNLTFADEGIEVISVGDGDSAMQKFEEFLPDLVMADVNMPGLTGYEICQIIKQNDETRHIPVILLVGSFEPFDEAEASRVGANDYLTKPFQSIRQLVNKVTDLLNRKEVVSEEPQVEAENAPPVDRFADTLEFEDRKETPTEFGDAGMDDEMIETSPANDYYSDSGYQADTTIDYAKTQPLKADDLKDFNIFSDRADSAPETEAETFESTVEDVPQASFEEPADEEKSSEMTEEADAEENSAEETGETRSEKSQTSGDYEETSAEEADQNKVDYESGQSLNYDAPSDREIFESEPSENEETAQPETLAEEPADLVDESATEDSSEPEKIDDRESFREESEEPEEQETRLGEESEREEDVEGETEDGETSKSDLFEAVKTPEAETETKQSESDVFEAEKQTPPAESPRALSFDDGDLLELPPLVEETGIRPQAFVQEANPETPPEIVAEPEIEVAETTPQTETVAAANVMQSFPPELIELIAQKVAEKISDKAIRDIAWEVVPQMTELIIKKMAEEKMKE